MEAWIVADREELAKYYLVKGVGFHANVLPARDSLEGAGHRAVRRRLPPLLLAGELAGRGGEGMVVKPLAFIHRGGRGLSQPAVKCRGREYPRIIYGPDYTTGANLTRLRSWGLGRKRSLALGALALGVEGLEQFVRGEPLRPAHECVFGVLALESEPVDPRL